MDRSAASPDREHEVFAGTLVLRGRAIGCVRHIGAHTELGRIASQLGRDRVPPLVHEQRRTAARISAIAVILGALFLPLA